MAQVWCIYDTMQFMCHTRDATICTGGWRLRLAAVLMCRSWKESALHWSMRACGSLQPMGGGRQASDARNHCPWNSEAEERVVRNCATIPVRSTIEFGKIHRTDDYWMTAEESKAYGMIGKSWPTRNDQPEIIPKFHWKRKPALDSLPDWTIFSELAFKF